MTGIDSLPPLRDVIERHDLKAKKSLGQNFLLDLNLTGKIARAAGDLSRLDVIEVGPGTGTLTEELLFGQLENGGKATVDAEDGGVVLRYEGAGEAAAPAA